MLPRLTAFLFGSPLPTHELAHKRLSKILALASYSPGALSSIAYANQEIFLALMVAGSSGLIWSFPVGLVITILLVMVALSYYQTIFGYPSGGGSYVVAHENLGIRAGQLAAAALMIDYVLTAAVSLTAGFEAIASAFPELWPYRLTVTLILLAVITLLNMRGMQETGIAMSIPVYFFLLTYLGMLLYGFARAIIDGPGSHITATSTQLEPLTIILILRAFSSGSTALTGIEAISNGVPSFRSPEAKNASRTLIAVALLMGILFLGSLGLTQYLAVTPGPQETILSALAHRLVGNGPLYFLVQISTLLILVVAANTSFAGFPQLVAILAKDGYLPRQLTNLGDRLVFSNGMLLLASATAFLIIIFKGSSHALIPLFAVGVFLAFTLSQAGMVVHWYRIRGNGWRIKSVINGLGAVGTGITLLVVAVSKFTHGAWLTLTLISLLVWGFQRIHDHFQQVKRELSLSGLPPSLRPVPKLRLVVPISGVHRATIAAINYARSLSDHISAVYIEVEPLTAETIRARWQAWFPDIPLFIMPSPYRSIVGPLLEFLDSTDREYNDGQLAAVLLPEVIPARGWQSLLHNQGAWLIKAALIYRRRNLGYQRLIIDVPFHLKH